MSRMKKIIVTLLIAAVAVGCAKKEEPETVKVEPSAPAMTVDQFMEAALNGQEDVISKAIAQKLDVNVRGPEERTAIMLAAFNGHSKVVNMLAEAKAQVDAKDSTGRTALMYASTGKDTATVKNLLHHGAGINEADGVENFTPLMWAAAEGNMEVVKILLSAGADVNMKDIDGDTAGSFAGKNGHAEIAAMLKQAEERK